MVQREIFHFTKQVVSAYSDIYLHQTNKSHFNSLLEI